MGSEPAETVTRRRRTSKKSARAREGADAAAGAPSATTPADPDPAEIRSRVVAHLEYLGYTADPAEPDGWTFARHPFRFNIHVRPMAWGTRLQCVVPIGAAKGNTRDRWAAYLNGANERSMLTQFSIYEDPWSGHSVRMLAFIPGTYSRETFAIAMDLWHEDLDNIRHKPDFVDEAPTPEQPAAAVN